MNKYAYLTLTGLITSTMITSCIKTEQTKYTITSKKNIYEYQESCFGNTFIVNGQFLYYDHGNNDTLNAIGVFASSGRGTGGIATTFINDTTTNFFKIQRKTYEKEYLPLIKALKKSQQGIIL